MISSNSVAAQIGVSDQRAKPEHVNGKLSNILQAFIVHGMVICGDPISYGGHFGDVATGAPDEQASKECRGLAKKVAMLAAKLHSG